MGLPDIENIPETGAVFTIGRSRFADNVASHFFIRKDPVLTITCGDEHSAVVCQSGRLFVFGSNDWGQLGLGHKNHVSKPSCVKILKPEKVTHVACGRAHTLICTGGQKIFACGSDQEGQLGRGNAAVGDSASTPVLVYDCGLAGPRVTQIAAGSHHSMALTSDGGVIAWGSNLEGQLGLSGISGLVNKPTKVPIPEPVKEISTGYYHSAFLTESGLIYICGESESGKLGIDVNFTTQVAPKQMLLPTTAIHIACGGHHTLILTESGNVYCVGSNASGQLGMGTNVTEIPTPKLLSRDALQDQSIVKIACGESHSAVLTESGKLYTCGDGRHGKLGLEENENNVHELTFAIKYQELFVSNVSCGGCHTILLGKRRETNNQTNQESETIQIDHQIQRKNSLPPLKLPVNRLQNESHMDKVEDEKESTESEKILEKSPSEDNQENKLDNEHNDIPETPKDSMNNFEKLEIPATNEVSEETQKVNEVENSEITSEKEDAENNNEENTMKTNNESNVDIEKPSESTKADVDVDSNNVIDKTEETIKTEESKIEDETKTSPEKPTSPDPMPPPKPPRQKTASPQGSVGEDIKVSSKYSEEEERKENNQDSNPKPNEAKETEESIIRSMTEKINKEEESPAKVSINSHKSRSTKSNADTEETIVADPQHTLDELKTDKITKNEENVEEHTHDDADVIQSPAPRTGKMAKLFKGKRQQETENGTKSSGSTTPKSKSKTCIIL